MAPCSRQPPPLSLRTSSRHSARPRAPRAGPVRPQPALYAPGRPCAPPAGLVRLDRSCTPPASPVRPQLAPCGPYSPPQSALYAPGQPCAPQLAPCGPAPPVRRRLALALYNDNSDCAPLAGPVCPQLAPCGPTPPRPALYAPDRPCAPQLAPCGPAPPRPTLYAPGGACAPPVGPMRACTAPADPLWDTTNMPFQLVLHTAPQNFRRLRRQQLGGLPPQTPLSLTVV